MNLNHFKKKLYTSTLGSYRSIYYFLFCLVRSKMPIADKNEKIDIIIPVIEKDLNILPLCLQGVQNCINNAIEDIYIIAPAKESIIQFANKHHLVFIDEGTLLGYSPMDIHFITNSGVNRSGWIFQQLLKLSGAVGKSRFFAVIDSDHILLRPHTFITSDKKQVFYQSKEYYYPYYANIKRLTGSFPYQHLSYIAHKMIFDKVNLNLLRKMIEEQNPSFDRWDKVIINSLDRQYSSSFSEFELYGHSVDKSQKMRFPWKQKELQKGIALPSYEKLRKQYSSSYLSVTFPDYLPHK